MGGEQSARLNIKTQGTPEEHRVIAGTFFHCHHVCIARPGRNTVPTSTPPYNQERTNTLLDVVIVHTPGPCGSSGYQLASNEGCSPAVMIEMWD